MPHPPADLLLKDLVEHLPAVLYKAEFGWDGRWFYVSPQIESLVGYTPEEWKADPELWAKRIHPDDRERTLAEEGVLVDSDSSQLDYSEYRLVRKDGGVVWVSDRAFVVRDEQGEPLYFEGFLTNISEGKEAEVERDALHNQLREAQKMEALGRLAGGVAHDFNNLLAIILNCTQFALDDLEPTHPTRADLDQVMGASERAVALVRQLLAFTRREIHSPVVVNLNDVIRGFEKLLQRTIEESVTVLIDLAPDAWLVNVDPRQIEQILMNLVLNARDAMPTGGEQTIRTENRSVDHNSSAERPDLPPGDYVCLSVTDTGFGMSKEIADQIFEPFFTTKPVGKGSGLGLATTYGIAKQAGGNIYVDSEPGRGTRIDVFIPATTSLGRQPVP